MVGIQDVEVKELQSLYQPQKYAWASLASCTQMICMIVQSFKFHLRPASSYSLKLSYYI
jgi:hypothetical protein